MQLNPGTVAATNLFLLKLFTLLLAWTDLPEIYFSIFLRFVRKKKRYGCFHICVIIMVMMFLFSGSKYHRGCRGYVTFVLLFKSKQKIEDKTEPDSIWASLSWCALHIANVLLFKLYSYISFPCESWTAYWWKEKKILSLPQLDVIYIIK